MAAPHLTAEDINTLKNKRKIPMWSKEDYFIMNWRDFWTGFAAGAVTTFFGLAILGIWIQ